MLRLDSKILCMPACSHAGDRGSIHCRGANLTRTYWTLIGIDLAGWVVGVCWAVAVADDGAGVGDGERLISVLGRELAVCSSGMAIGTRVRDVSQSE